MSSPEIFDALVIGLSEFLLADGKYPYPDLLRRACNGLALHMTSPSYPRTWSGLLTLLEKPVSTWYPLAVPDTFESGAGLTYDGVLSEEASRYLHQDLSDRAGIEPLMPTRVNTMALHNKQFQLLLERLQGSPNPERAQREYVQLRSFLIEYPYTTRTEISRTFAVNSVRPEDVGRLYEDCLPHELHWLCDNCGPLLEKHGKLRGVRPSICNVHGYEVASTRQVLPAADLCRVRPGIHWRVTLPGIPEIRLFRTIESLQAKHPKQLVEVLLWPGIDRYDLRLCFGDGTAWAIDVKDHENPYRLAANLKPVYGEGGLEYDEAFYVVPARRLRARTDYIAILYEGSSLPNTHVLTSIPDLEARVTSKIQCLQKERRG